MPDLAVLHNPEFAEQIAGLANRLQLPLVETAGLHRFILLFNANQQLGIRDTQTDGNPVFAGFDKPRKNRGRDPLMRAIGYQTSTVLDATAGWAKDAAHIAAHGIHVCACEQNNVIFSLISNALEHCKDCTIVDNLKLLNNNGIDCMKELSPAPEVIYLDPMYPRKQGSAAPRKPLQLLQALLETDITLAARNEMEQRLLHAARGAASRRVVVKRPHHAPPISSDHSGAISGKLVRFDLYPPYPAATSKH